MLWLLTDTDYMLYTETELLYELCYIRTVQVYMLIPDNFEVLFNNSNDMVAIVQPKVNPF